MALDTELTIGFLGVGAIGRPIADRMLRVTPLVICDVSEAARAPFEGRAMLVRTASQLGSAADIVFACLPSLQSYRDAILGAEGLINGSRVSQVIHIGTTGPKLVVEMLAALKLKQIELLDAPVTGGTPRARAGELMVMVSGSRAAFEGVKTLIHAYASAIVYLGERPGMAQTMKLINNLLSAANLAIASEMLVLGVKAGLDPRQMLEVLNGGTGQNSATLTKLPDHVLPRTFDYGGRLEIVHKDLAMLVHEAGQLAVAAPLAAMIETTYRDAIAQEGSESDMTTIIRPMERSAGVEVGGS